MINIKVYDTFYEVNPCASLTDIQKAEPKFFETKHGKRESYIIYRGCLIVRHTVQFTGCAPQRLTVCYLFGYNREEKCKGTFCIGHPNSIYMAKQLIDKILDSGVYK